MKLTHNISFRLILVNILVVLVIFVISFVYLHQLNKIENIAVNKLVIINERQNTLEKLQYQILKLELDSSTLLLQQSDAARLRVSQRLKLLTIEVNKAKTAGGIDLLALAKLENNLDDFSRNTTKIDQLFKEIQQVNTEVLIPQFDIADLLISELESSLYKRSNFSMAKTFFEIHQYLTHVKYSFVIHERTLDIVKSNEYSNNKRKLKALIDNINLSELNSQEQSVFYSLQSFLISYNDTVAILNNRMVEKDVVQRKLFELQHKTQKNIADKLVADMNMKVTAYNMTQKHNFFQTRKIIWVLASLTIIFSALLGWYLRKMMVRPVSDLVKLMTLLAESNFKQLLKTTKHSYTHLMSREDQFGEIARACEASAKYQQRIIFDIDTACQSLTLGFLDQHTSFDYQGEYKLVERALNSSKENIKALVEDIIISNEALVAGRLDNKSNMELYLGHFKPISDSMMTLITNLKGQLDDIVIVTTSMEFGLEDKKRFIVPRLNYQGEFGKIQRSLDHAVQSLSASAQQNLDQDWLKSGLSDMNRELTGEQPLEILTKNSVDFIAEYFNAPIGYIYQTFEDIKTGKTIKMIAHYGVLMDEKTKATRYKFVYPEGVGLIGQVFVSPEIIIKKLNDVEKIPISQSGIASAVINYVVVLPLIHEGKIEGVLELGLYESPSAIQKEFLLQVMNNLGIAMNVAISRGKINQLLAQSQLQAEELELQQSKQAQSNEMLQHKAQELEEKQQAVEQKNRQLEEASKVMEEKAEELILASKYKSEFLANMSHELRSPLNSLLILSKLLIDNNKQHLDAKEVKYAEVIYRSGTDLLQLIEDILEFSKIEAGKTDIYYRSIATTEIVDELRQRFTELANQKQLTFDIDYAKAPRIVDVDKQRLLQIITNLLSNAFKFTERGGVQVMIEVAGVEYVVEDTYGDLQQVTHNTLCLKISDTGIGIDQEQKHRVFQAFQQADGTTSRKYGGTGLGLSITLQLVELMGGFIHVNTLLEEGSQFAVYLPLRPADFNLPPELPLLDNATANVPAQALEREVSMVEDEQVVTILLCAAEFNQQIVSKILERGFKVEQEHNLSKLLKVAELSKPQGVIFIPTTVGHEAEQLLKKLNSATGDDQVPLYHQLIDASEAQCLNHLAIDQFLSAIEAEQAISQQQIMQNYFEFAEVLAGKMVLIVDDNISNVFALSAILEQHKMRYLIANNGIEAIDIIQQHSDIDLILMDIMMPELDGYKTMSAIREKAEHVDTPIIALTAKAMPEDRNKCILAGANDYMTKPVSAQKLLALMKMWIVTTPNHSTLTAINEH